jgi:hypothetical protein
MSATAPIAWSDELATDPLAAQTGAFARTAPEYRGES